MHYFKTISGFKLELQSGNAQFKSKLMIYCPVWSLKFDRWPWKTIWHLFYAISNFVHHLIAISQFKLELQSGNAQCRSKSVIFFVPCDLEIWWMTLKNNRVPFLCYFKLHAFYSQQSIQAGVTARKHKFRVKISNFLSCVTSKFDRWSWKTIGHLFHMLLQALCIIS